MAWNIYDDVKFFTTNIFAVKYKRNDEKGRWTIDDPNYDVDFQSSY